MVLAPDDVGDGHVGVVDHVGQEEERVAVGLADPEVLDRRRCRQSTGPRIDVVERRSCRRRESGSAAAARAPGRGPGPGRSRRSRAARRAAWPAPATCVGRAVAGVDRAGGRAAGRWRRRRGRPAADWKYGPSSQSRPSQRMARRMPSVCSGRLRAVSVSSMRRTNVPPCWRANSQLNRAVRAVPTWKYPVGEGAMRTRGPVTPSGYPAAARRVSSGADRAAQLASRSWASLPTSWRRSLARASRSMRRTRSAVRSSSSPTSPWVRGSPRSRP